MAHRLFPLPPLVLGLGSNQGDRLLRLRSGVERLSELLGVEFLASSLFQSEPLGPSQPDFLNAALLCRTSRDPMAILRRAQQVEAEQGRVRGERWGPRTLDIDLLWAGWSINEPELRVPHPELAQRAFAAVPLVELWQQLPDRHAFPLPPELFEPELLRARAGQRLERIADSSWASS
jgi:2-amino-4-hydroxy-6-hydroxymethyldihydropteridine diphosphokinase